MVNIAYGHGYGAGQPATGLSGASELCQLLAPLITAGTKWTAEAVPAARSW